MKAESSQTLKRQWAMLRIIPRWPRRITIRELASRLADQGFSTTRRTVERDLQELSGSFPLDVDERAKPYGWYWAKNANFEFTPRLTVSQSVALLLSRAHLQSLMPRSMLDELAPVFANAETELAATGWRDWHRRTAVIPATFPLLPPKLDMKVLESVQSALAQRCCLSARYRAKGNDTAKEAVIHPLGLLVRGPVQYLVCTMYDYTDVLRLPLHRLSHVVVLAEPAKQPAGFDFARYVAENAVRFNARGKIRLVAWFDEAAAEHLKETPVSRDQVLRGLEGTARVEFTATVEYDETLRWWLMGFGSQVEVKEPLALRADLMSELSELLWNYPS